jgi:ketosteroid isomerase-like protein
MRHALLLAALASTLLAAPAVAGPAEDAATFVATIMDRFNGGDAKAFIAAHTDDATIVDEFGQHIWTGKGSAQKWMDDYAAESKTLGVTAGRVDYGKPMQANSDGSVAYIVLPTTYRFTQNGKKMAADGSMTFVVKKAGADWKIASWTYSGAAWAPEKEASATPEK